METPHPSPLRIAIVGFGNFGQFLAQRFVRQGHQVVGSSRTDYSAVAQTIGARYYANVNEMMDVGPDVVIFATSIMSLRKVLDHFPIDRLAGLLVVDVLSVKSYPHELFLSILPESADLLCTHPMFGPESGRETWEGLPFVYDRARIRNSVLLLAPTPTLPKSNRLNGPPNKFILDLLYFLSQDRCDRFLLLWEMEKCSMVPLSCAQHDEYAASTQFITHTMGRVLGELDVKSTPINTRGYESLLGVVNTTCSKNPCR